MKILVDNLIQDIRKTGGIRRYFDNCLPLIKKNNPQLKITTYSSQQAPSSTQSGDVFHSTYYTTHPNKDIPQVVTVYDMIHELLPQYFPGIKNHLFRWKKSRVIKSADHLICISQNTRKTLISLFPSVRQKVSIVYPGVSPIFKKLPPNKKTKTNFFKKHHLKKPFILYLGSRGRYKNFPLFLQAYSQWSKNSQFDLVTIGGNQFTPVEKNLITRLKLGKQVLNFQSISDRELILFYNYAHVFTSPSLYEGFGIPLIEAMACGTLVLASKKSSFPEIGKDSILYFNPNSLTSIIKGLESTTTLSPSSKSKLTNKAIQRAKFFSWDKTAHQITDIYKQLI